MIADRSVVPTSDESGQIHSDTRVTEGLTTHQLKCWPEFFQAILEGRKTHDLRRADDRHFNVGDHLQLREFDPKTERYTGREQTAEITYITSSDIPCALSARALDRHFCILSIQKLI